MKINQSVWLVTVSFKIAATWQYNAKHLTKDKQKVKRAYWLQFYCTAYKSKSNELLPLLKVASSCERTKISARSKSSFINYTQIKHFLLGIKLTERSIRKYQKINKCIWIKTKKKYQGNLHPKTSKNLTRVCTCKETGQALYLEK